MIAKIDANRCVGCGACARSCPVDAIRMEAGKAKICYPEDCMTCYICELGCPVNAVDVRPFKGVPPEVMPGILEALGGGTR